MHIQRLEIIGFKSFKNKTVIEFDSGEITGIVGPNGCGKSNVVDALLWVMGESSPKHLRGESLSDIIFCGTGKEEPGLCAEVTLILNKGKFGFPENYKKFSELMITRRAYRDGKNEYFINQQSCLQREVREFFMNTGAGCRGFSIIEQASIEKLITAKPRERRFIIEEVAGISKFKNRKGESEKKLHLVNQNLQRLDDILKIQETQLSKLTSQAKKAEKYRELKQGLEKKEKEDLYHHYQSLEKEQTSFQNQSLEKAKQKEELEIQLKKEGLQLQSLEEDLEELRKQSLKKKMERSNIDHKINTFKMVHGIKDQQQALKTKEKSILKELDQLQIYFKKQGDFLEREKEFKKIRTDIEEFQLSKKDIEINRNVLGKQIQFLSKEQQGLMKEKKTNEENIQKTIQAKNTALSELQKHEQMSLTFTKDIKNICENEKILENETQKFETSSLNFRQEISLLKYKMEEMKKLISRFEDINEGATDLKKWKPTEFKALFRSLKVEPEYAKALGTILGHHIQALIPQEDIWIEQAVKRLKEQGKGKTSFLSSLPSFRYPVVSKEQLKSYPAFICFLDEKIMWNMSTEPLKPFLQQTAVVLDLNSAFDLKKQFPSFQFVTKEGDLITRDSLVYAGSTDKESSLFQIRDQIDQYSKELSNKERDIKVQNIHLEACLKQLKQIRKEKQDILNKSTQSSENLISLKKDVDQTEKELLRISENRSFINEKLGSFEKDKRNLLQHKEAYREEHKVLEETILRKQKNIRILEATVDEYKSKELEKSKLEMDILETNKDQQGLDQKVSLLLQLGRSSFNDSQDKETEVCSVLNLEQELEKAHVQKKQLEIDLSLAEKQLEKRNELKKQQEKNRKDFEDQIFQIKVDTNNFQSEREKRELSKNHIKDKFLENYQMQIEDFYVAPLSEEILLEKLKEEIVHYQNQLSKIKEVNFLALDEYEKLSKDNLFLSTQKEDLVNSRKELLRVISHIDNICDRRFKDILGEINKRFSKVFPIVFQGDNAKAELVLHQEEESNELGVDILVHPPGKRPQSVTLLSRGEKALTAICLIYSLFLVKPSPFCVIDEADAPLDDANIFRFISILKEMSRKSQIVVITHNKYTMQACKYLYGVTMERPGISQIVSVNMKTMEFPPSN